MTSFADKLLAASEDLDSLSEYEVAALLRRAAIRLDAATSKAGEPVMIRSEILAVLDRLALENELTRDTLASAIMRDWLTSHGVMERMDEDTDTEGSA